MLTPTRTTLHEYRSAGFWEDRTLSSFLAEASADHPNAVAVCTAADSVSYRQLRESAARVAAGLRCRGVQRHDVVTIMLPNWPEAVEAIQGVHWAGCVLNPVVSTYRSAELTYILRQSGARAILIPHVFRGFDYVAMLSELMRDMDNPPLVVVVRAEGELPQGFTTFEALRSAEPVETCAGDPRDICLLLFTSGTTSDPKGVLHSHQTVVWEMRSMVRELELGTGDDSTFMPSPVGHLTGLVYGVYLPSLLGQSTSLLDVWDADAAVDIIERDGCRISLGATPFLRGLVNAYRDRGMSSSLRLFLCGGADVPADLVEEAGGVLDAAVTRTYGSSEFPTFSVSRPSAPVARRAGTDGLPIHPAEGKLIAAHDGIGELAVRGPELFLGYLDSRLNEQAFTEDGYFRTGDLVHIDESGAVTVRGRLKDIIIRGGENISALEIETHLLTHPAVDDVAVVGYVEEAMGERVGAFVVLRSEAEVTVESMGTYLQGRGLAAHKRPEAIEIVAELPRTASGKVQKHVLRQQLSRR
jgi:cyclohexanecarboxylate-CoA ligase